MRNLTEKTTRTGTKDPAALRLRLAEVPATTDPQRFVVMFLKETSLLLCGFALLGLLLAGPNG